MNLTEQINPEKMYISEEVTDYLRVSLRTTQRLLKSGLLPSFKVHGQYRIKGIDILNYLNGVRVDINQEFYDQENSNKSIELIDLLEIIPVEIKLSVFLAKEIDNNKEEFLENVRALREKITLDMGFICSGIRFTDDDSFTDNQFSILINGIKIYQHKGENLKEVFSKAEKIIKKYAHEILSREEVFVILEKLRKTYPVMVEEVLSDEPSENKLNIGQLTKILRSLLKEQVSIRNMRIILESIADNIFLKNNIEELINKVRESLSRQFGNSFAIDGVIDVIGIGIALENYLMENTRTENDGYKYFDIRIDTSQAIHEELSKIYQKTQAKVIICHTDIRKPLREMLERNFYDINVLSYKEIAKEYKFNLVDKLSLQNHSS